MAAHEIPTLEEIRAMFIEVVEEKFAMIVPPEKKDAILSREEIMSKFRIGETTLWKRMNDGSLPFFKIGRRVYFSQHAVEMALKNSNQR